MNRYINILLCGFIVFVIGIIIFNFELNKFEYIRYLPDEFDESIDKFEFSIQKGKNYTINKSKYNQNIQIEKKVEPALKNSILVEVKHKDTSVVHSNIHSDKDNTYITFSNELNINRKDIDKIFNLVLKCITDKKIYNYNLLKYSEITIYGSEDILSSIEIDGYEA